MVDLLDSERIAMIRSAVLIQNTRVADRRTELAWHIRAIAYMLSRVKSGGKLKRFEKMAFKGAE